MPLSADGIELQPGVPVVHFYGEWETASPVLLVVESTGIPLIVFRDEYNSIVHYPADCVFASKRGLCQDKINRLSQQVLFWKTEIALAEEKITELTAEL